MKLITVSEGATEPRGWLRMWPTWRAGSRQHSSCSRGSSPPRASSWSSGCSRSWITGPRPTTTASTSTRPGATPWAGCSPWSRSPPSPSSPWWRSSGPGPGATCGRSSSEPGNPRSTTAPAVAPNWMNPSELTLTGLWPVCWARARRRTSTSTPWQTRSPSWCELWPRDRLNTHPSLLLTPDLNCEQCREIETHNIKLILLVPSTQTVHLQ